MKIIGIETSSTLFSLCISEENTMIYEIRKDRLMDKNSKNGHFFVEAMRLNEYLTSERIDAIAIDIGPGMFTSLRVGLGLAKGFALVKNIPIVSVNSLDIIGSTMSFLDQPVLAVIDAFRQEIYAALYKKGERLTDYLLTTPAKITEMINEKTMVVGSGIKVFKNSNTAYELDNLDFIEKDFLLPDASKVVKTAFDRIQSRQFDDPEALEPFYLKKTDAERNYNKTNAV